MGYLGGSQNYNWGGGSEDPYEGKHDMWHNELPGTDVVPEIYYSTEFYTGYAIDKIEKRNTTRPLWIHVAYQAMHGGGSRGFPPAQDVINQTKVGFRSQEYGNALRSLDSGIRNITDVLKSEGLWDNTLVMIWADVRVAFSPFIHYLSLWSPDQFLHECGTHWQHHAIIMLCRMAGTTQEAVLRISRSLVESAWLGRGAPGCLRQPLVV